MAAIASFALLAAGCGAATPMVDPVAVTHSTELYHALACDSCHGLDAAATTRSYGSTTITCAPPPKPASMHPTMAARRQPPPSTFAKGAFRFKAHPTPPEPIHDNRRKFHPTRRVRRGQRPRHLLQGIRQW